MTAILIGWFTDRGMVGQDKEEISTQEEVNTPQDISIHKEESAQQPDLDQQAEVSILREQNGHHTQHEHDGVSGQEADCRKSNCQEVDCQHPDQTKQECNIITPVRLSRAANMRKVREESRKLGNTRKKAKFQDQKYQEEGNL